MRKACTAQPIRVVVQQVALLLCGSALSGDASPSGVTEETIQVERVVVSGCRPNRPSPCECDHHFAPVLAPELLQNQVRGVRTPAVEIHKHWGIPRLRFIQRWSE